MRTDLSLASGRHGVTVLVGLLAGGALVQDQVSPTVTVQGEVFDRAPGALVVAVLAGVVILVALRERLGVVGPLSAIALLGLASLSAPVWVLNSNVIFLLVMLLCGLAGYMSTSWFHRAGIVVLWVVAVV